MLLWSTSGARNQRPGVSVLAAVFVGFIGVMIGVVVAGIWK
jgi:hypothetical protein